jgi:general secretion pathway protein H
MTPVAKQHVGASSSSRSSQAGASSYSSLNIGAARGFTLIELMVVLFLIALFSSLVIPRLPDIGAGGPERGARRIAGTIKFLYNEAALSGREHRLFFDLDANALRPRTLNNSNEIVAVKGLAEETKLPSGAKLLDVAVAGQEKVSSGVTTLTISPTGWLPQTVIHLESSDRQILTIRLLSYTGSAEVYEGYREF